MAVTLSVIWLQTQTTVQFGPCWREAGLQGWHRYSLGPH